MAKIMKRIYLDYHATTPLNGDVRDAMLEWMGEQFGNPHSAHEFGRKASDQVENARRVIAQNINAKRTDIIFTSGATEAANNAIFGIAPYLKLQNKMRILTLQGEHEAVSQPLRILEQQGFEVVALKPMPDGRLNFADLPHYVKGDQALGLVAVMHSHNEIGVLQDIAKLAEFTHENDGFIFSDMTQSLGKTPINMIDMQVDLACFSAHKLYGPMGIGALYCKTAIQKYMQPHFYGGGQQRLRSGTIPVFLTVGFAKAVQIALENLPDEMIRLGRLRDQFYVGLQNFFPDIIVNGSLQYRLAGNLHLTFPQISSEKLLYSLPELQFSTGAACSSGNDKGSEILRALGYPQEGNHGHIRLCVGALTREEDIVDCLALFQQRLRHPKP